MKTRRIYIQETNTTKGCESVSKETTVEQSSCCGSIQKQEETIKVSTCC